jgi:hypothetical protein
MVATSIPRRRKIFLIVGLVFLFLGVFSFILFPPASGQPQPENKAETSREIDEASSDKGFFADVSDQLSSIYYYLGRLVAEVIVPRLSPESRGRLYEAIRIISFIYAIVRAYFFHFLALLAAVIILYRTLFPVAGKKRRKR